MRTPIIAANWKMFKTISTSVQDVISILAARKEGVTMIIFPSFLAVAAVSDALKGTGISVGVQDIYFEDEGAFTGEVSARMVKECASHVLIGHSERRQLFGETDAHINKKMKAAIAASLIPILCVGETLAKREAGETEDILRVQLREGLDGIDCSGQIIIAYEPVWAIGTGKVATTEQAQAAHAFIRSELNARCPGHAETIPILYGGSVKPGNIKGLMEMDDIDGGLVGGASLDPKEFSDIIKNC